jgi:hypothetical protein
MPYAALFKIYFIDSFVVRQLERLKARVGHGDLYVIADETNGPIAEIPHDRVIRVTEADMIDRGFVHGSPNSSIFWHSADYSLFRLFEDRPDCAHYITVEYDAVLNTDIDALVAAVGAGGYDFVGQKIERPAAEWHWAKTCDRIYDTAVLRPYLNAIALYSARAIPVLRDRRLELSRQFRDGEIDQFPISEAFIATELALAGQKVGSLSEFGDISRFDWWPPSEESELDALERCTFIHPVLAGERYIDSLLRSDRLGALFRPDSPVARKLMALEPRDYIPKLLPKLINRRRPPDRQFSIEQVRLPLFEQPDPGPNIALGKPATQSSVSPYSRNRSLRLDAAGAVNGLVTGSFGFHTGSDEPAWWMVDLEGQFVLDQIWVFNRIDLPGRARDLTLEISRDGRDWVEVLRRRSEEPFGGAYGEPLIVTLPQGLIARFVRIELDGKQHLHLDQVKIFGAPSGAETAPAETEVTAA